MEYLYQVPRTLSLLLAVLCTLRISNDAEKCEKEVRREKEEGGGRAAYGVGQMITTRQSNIQSPSGATFRFLIIFCLFLIIFNF